jgi:hypothetical protein
VHIATLNSLQTGNLRGKITISVLNAAILEHEAAAPQELFGKFPKQTIRESFPKNREFYADTGEINPLVFGAGGNTNTQRPIGL